ncbi:hypothetical protein PCL_13019 [Purpureocillium lilacinum]|uniref:Uncharacterized protein n=1 Tax=Purpureocillium lilacinum TaxID=33203 RepID=A0A2U3E7X4_PURLI|nr:hypothetical protein Purlil1_6045 [Purpureocillium lilacinum]PWI70620.1 hypothetical protein PCL_13019 [Purpureocillium lilacinum]
MTAAGTTKGPFQSPDQVRSDQIRTGQGAEKATRLAGCVSLDTIPNKAMRSGDALQRPGCFSVFRWSPTSPNPQQLTAIDGARLVTTPQDWGVPRAACTAPAFACTWRATAQRRSQLPPPPQLSVNNRDVGGLKPARRATVTNDRDDNDDSTEKDAEAAPSTHWCHTRLPLYSAPHVGFEVTNDPIEFIMALSSLLPPWDPAAMDVDMAVDVDGVVVVVAVVWMAAAGIEDRRRGLLWRR